MATAPAPRPRLATLLVAALVLALAWQLAYWTWVFLAPRAEPAAAAPAEGGVDLAVAARLFGGTAGAPAAAPGASASGLRLKGVVAPSPGRTASAVFSTGAGRDRAVLLDAEVQPGVKLVEVHPDHAVVSRGGVRERIDLEARRGGSAAPGAAKAAGFRVGVARSGTNSFSFSRKELDEALRDPAQLNHLGQIAPGPRGEVRMVAAPAGSLAWKLGLQPGDIIRRVNGQAVASTGDLARLYQQFGTLSLIQAEVQRGSATVQLSYSIQQ